MSRKSKMIVLGLLLAAIFSIIAYPRLGAPGGDGRFSAAPDPQAALSAAAAAGQPAFLEFYGSG